jgi:hypothetical protein
MKPTGLGTPFVQENPNVLLTQTNWELGHVAPLARSNIENFYFKHCSRNHKLEASTRHWTQGAYRLSA